MRRGASSVFGCALKHTFFVPQAQCSEAAEIVNSKQIIEFVERPYVNRVAGAPGLLSPLCVVALDDPPAPAIGLSVGDRSVKYRPVSHPLVKLRSRNEL